MDYQKVLNNIIELVKEVGAFQLEAKKEQNFTVSTKGDSIDFVTDIDKKSEEMIISRIKELYPDHSVLGEETGMTDMESDYKWVIDPIDGTTNFVHNFPLHCISIGLKYKEVAVIGVVDIPTINMRFTTVRGDGAYLNGEPIKVSKVEFLATSVIATGFPYFRKENNVNLPYFNKIVSNIAGIRRTGSAAIDLCFVSAGMLDGYWEFALNEWDICAGLLLVEEAGGKITETNQDGYPLLICGNHKIHDELVENIVV